MLGLVLQDAKIQELTAPFAAHNSLCPACHFASASVCPRLRTPRNQVKYDDGDFYAGDWNADGKVATGPVRCALPARAAFRAPAFT